MCCLLQCFSQAWVGRVVLPEGADVHETRHVVAGSSMSSCTPPQGCGVCGFQLQSKVEGLAAASRRSVFELTVANWPLADTDVWQVFCVTAKWQGMPKTAASRHEDALAWMTRSNQLCSCSPLTPLVVAAGL
jgi:hypothetical protein